MFEVIGSSVVLTDNTSCRPDLLSWTWRTSGCFQPRHLHLGASYCQRQAFWLYDDGEPNGKPSSMAGGRPLNVNWVCRADRENRSAGYRSQIREAMEDAKQEDLGQCPMLLACIRRAVEAAQ